MDHPIPSSGIWYICTWIFNRACKLNPSEGCGRSGSKKLFKTVFWPKIVQKLLSAGSISGLNSLEQRRMDQKYATLFCITSPKFPTFCISSLKIAQFFTTKGKKDFRAIPFLLSQSRCRISKLLWVQYHEKEKSKCLLGINEIWIMNNQNAIIEII